MLKVEGIRQSGDKLEVPSSPSTIHIVEVGNGGLMPPCPKVPGVILFTSL
jgi:hypothetical protein